MVTIKSVAQEANVSVGTVSNVLNGLSTVKKENRERVMDAIKRLGYEPNAVARMLKTNKSNTICLVLPDITNPFYPEVARGVGVVAQEAGYVLVLANSERSAKNERLIIQEMSRRNVDGLILVKPHISIEELNSVNSKIPLVLVDYEDNDLVGCDIVNVDDYSGAMMAMNLLLRYKHKRIAFICGLLEGKSDKDRLNAYRDALAYENITVDESLIKYGEYTWHSGYENAASLMMMMKRPTAVFASNDVLAIGAMKAASAVGLRVPEDISIIGYDDIGMSSMYTPQITTIYRPKLELGTLVMDTLLKRINSSETCKYPKQVAVSETSVKIRDTVNTALKALGS